MQNVILHQLPPLKPKDYALTRTQKQKQSRYAMMIMLVAMLLVDGQPAGRGRRGGRRREEMTDVG